MNRGVRRTLIPPAFQDLETWPQVDLAWLSAEERGPYSLRKRAVELYADGTSFAQIHRETNKNRAEVRRLVNRCLTPDGRGFVLGFTALLAGLRLMRYVRRAPVHHIEGQGSGGCAGALEQLFERLPDVEEFVVGLFLKRAKDVVHEARISYRSLQKQFLKKLRELGFTDQEWPFNTSNKAYKSLRKYCLNLRRAEEGRWVSVRLGAEASRRSNLGRGRRSLIPVLRPYLFVQLDYHKVDAASVIILKNEHDEDLEVPVARWHIGLLVEEKCHLVIGVYIALEMTPSGDSCLEIVHSALFPDAPDPDDPRVQFIADKMILPNQLIPELAFRCWSGLKVDNAWANSANEVLANIINTVGCTVNFGPVRAWWARPLIERIFKELTEKGLQRLPSTYGTGVNDTRKTDPNEKAIKFRIHLTDLMAIVCQCVRAYNETPTEGLQFSSPLGAIKAALNRSTSGFFPQLLPVAVQRQPLLLTHEEVCTVRGSVPKHVRPHIRTDRCRYTNDALASSHWLIGKKIVAYVNRPDCRIAHAVVKDTGEPLGLLYPEAKWERSRISWRDRKLINSSGLAKALAHVSSDPVADWSQAKQQELRKARKAKRDKKRSSGAALPLARIHMEKGPSARPPSQAPDPVTHLLKVGRRDPFGLGTVPNTKSVPRR
jgi:putative transposase